MCAAKWIRLGKITAPQGIRGEVRVLPDTDFPERFAERQVYLYLPETDVLRGPLEVRLSHCKPRMLVLSVEGVNTREEAEELRGAIIQVPAESLPELPEGQYYHHQLVGLRVMTTDGRKLGVLQDVLPTGGNDVYVVRSTDTEHEWLIPAIREVVREIDLEQGIMSIQPLPGLLDQGS